MSLLLFRFLVVYAGVFLHLYYIQPAKLHFFLQSHQEISIKLPKKVFFLKKSVKKCRFQTHKLRIMSFYLYFCPLLEDMNATININGRLCLLDMPKVMAVVNATDDSFYAVSRCHTADDILQRVEHCLAEGADIIDIGGCSTRPQSVAADAETEWRRLSMALNAVKAQYGNTLILSVDTFRVDIARHAVAEYGGMIINDVSGLGDEQMATTAAETEAPYIITWQQPSSANGMAYLAEAVDFLQRKIDLLQQTGVKDIIVDPGFGFNKTDEQNWELLKNMHCLKVLEKPVLAGLSRKSMLQRIARCDAADALNATTAAHMIALSEGADILRVHDVKAAKEAVAIYMQCKR